MSELQHIINQMRQATCMGLTSSELADVIQRLTADADWEIEKMQKPEVTSHD